MKAHGRQLTVSPKELARLEAAFGPQQRPPRTDATYKADRKANPDQYEKDPTGFGNVIHLGRGYESHCQRCGRKTNLLVQTSSLQGPCSLGDVVCLPCGNAENAQGRKLKIRRHAGKKSHTRGTDLL